MKLIIDALWKAQKEFPTIPKNSEANAGSYKYRYADLADVIKITHPVLHKYDMCISQSGSVVDGRQCLVTHLFHKSGESISSTFLLPEVKDPQDMGSAITYYRRYEQCALLGVVADSDDDAMGFKREPVAQGGQTAKLHEAGAPECCGKSMMTSKYIDNNLGHAPWFCLNCKNKIPKVSAS